MGLVCPQGHSPVRTRRPATGPRSLMPVSACRSSPAWQPARASVSICVVCRSSLAGSCLCAVGCAPRSGASGRPGRGKEGGQGKPRANPWGCGEGFPRVFPRTSRRLVLFDLTGLTATVERRSRAARQGAPCSQAQPAIARPAQWARVKLRHCASTVRGLYALRAERRFVAAGHYVNHPLGR
jgi:hypothetical protein